MPARPRKTSAAPTTKKTPAAVATPRPVDFEQDPARLIGSLGDLGRFGGVLGGALGGVSSGSSQPVPSNQPVPTHLVRVLRPDDLVVLEVAGFDVQLVQDAAGPALVPTAADAFLVITYSFQHMGEQAFSLADGETPFVPVQVLVAEPSRLAYSVPVGERIDYSSAGILAALSRLPLRVVPLAAPRPSGFTIGPLLPIHMLPGGLALAAADQGLVLTQGAPADRRATALPAVDALLAHANSLRTARRLLAHDGALDMTGLTGGPTIGRQKALQDTASITRTGIGDIIARPIPAPRPVRQHPRAPRVDETAIEAPWRLLISPSAQGAFSHSPTPRSAATDPDRVELWHSRLGTRVVAPDGSVTVDEVTPAQRIVRGVWARDKDGTEPTTQDQLPFRMSVSGLDRVMIVRQSSDPTITVPAPVDVDRLYLSSQGAWLDLHGSWDVEPYAKQSLPTLESWDHIAPMGRDQYVKLVYPGYLFPFGHRASLIKLTERRIDAAAQPVATLFQRFFLIVREPVRTYDDLTMPFVQVRLRPLVTPDIRDPNTPGTPNAVQRDQLFWPTIGTTKFEFTLDCLDHDGRRVVATAPLLFVGDEMGKTPTSRQLVRDTYTIPDSGPPPRAIPVGAQSVAMAKSVRAGDTAFETNALRFTGDPGLPGDLHSAPHLVSANIVVPAMKKLAPQSPPVDVHFAAPYLANGFDGVNAQAQVFLELATMTPISFGASSGGTTEKSGGFVQPDLPVRGLSRALGTVGQVDSLVTPPAGKQPFEPLDFLAGVLPKLFGLFSLVDILQAVGLDRAPQFVTQQLGEVAGMLDDLKSVQAALTDGIAQLTQDASRAATTPLRNAAAAAQSSLQALAGDFEPAFTALTDAITAFTTSGDESTLENSAKTALDTLAGTVGQLKTQLDALSLPPVVKARLERLAAALAPLAALAGQAAKILEQIQQLVDFVKGLDPENLAVKASFEWRPKLQNFPADKDKNSALFYVDEDGLLLSIEARASGKDGVGIDVLAELKDFGLNLFMDATLITIAIDRLSFRASNGRKPEVDVVMNTMQWQGVMSFIEVLEQLIPSDGFSDPPYVDVSPSGVKAGFDLALPSVGVGVFSLENISLGADVSVPFLGDAVTVGFHFCTREKPFRLTVMCVGGGGFVGLRISPKGIVLLEMSLEACAQLGIDLGVASGSVSITVGVYLRLEAEDGSLTGYFRIRGEVDVLGLISASITLELSLKYEFASGKLIGRASVDIEISILFFSFSVSVSCERRLAGSNSDPTFAEFLGIAADGTVPDPGGADGGVPAWTDYCNAFAGV